MSKSKLKGFSLGLVLGLIFMATATYALTTIQTRTLEGTAIGASANLQVTELDGSTAVKHDFGTLKVGSTSAWTVQIKNVGNDLAYVYWQTQPLGTPQLLGNGYELGATQNGTTWQSGANYAILLKEGAYTQATFTLSRTSGTSERFSFQILVQASV